MDDVKIGHVSGTVLFLVLLMASLRCHLTCSSIPYISYKLVVRLMWTFRVDYLTGGTVLSTGGRLMSDCPFVVMFGRL